MNNIKKIIITGGGTAGHIFPGIALAEQFIEKNKNSKILFVGSRTNHEKKIFQKIKYNHISLPIMPFKKKMLFKSFLKFFLSLLKSIKILYSFKPEIIISLGGYSAAPISLIGKINKIPLFICEQNILAGITNRILAKIADKIYTSFDKTIGFKTKKKIINYGNPLRKKIINIKKKKKNHFIILILGGSQGSNIINLAMIKALKYIKNLEKIKIIHQSGEQDEKILTKIYSSKNVNFIIKSFFNNIEQYYAKANIVISRAGATTISELIKINICSILIPYSIAKNNHQFLNAEFLTKKKCAILIEEKNLNGLTLAKYINNFIDNPQKISKIESKIKLIYQGNASKLITNDIYQTVEKKCL